MEQLTNRQVFVEIIAKKKGCVLCDLAIGILEEISSELHGLNLKWEVVDVGDRYLLPLGSHYGNTLTFL